MLEAEREVSGQEHMCNLFKVTERDGTVKYVTGTVRTGMDNNVILPYIGSSLMGIDRVMQEVSKQKGANVEYLGMLHSHPQWYGNSTDNDRFSYGDGLVAALSGKIYLTTLHGEVYALEREDGKMLIDSVKKRNRINRIDKRMDKRGISDSERPDWVVEGTSPGGFVDQHNAWARGGSFITFDTKTYDTRK